MAVLVFPRSERDAALAHWNAPENAKKPMIMRRSPQDMAYIIFENLGDSEGHPTAEWVEKGNLGSRHS